MVITLVYIIIVEGYVRFNALSIKETKEFLPTYVDLVSTAQCAATVAHNQLIHNS